LLGVPDVQGYLRRLGLDDPGPPSVAALAAIHRAQVERVPYNTIDIQLGRTTTVDPRETFDRVVATGRAGYCFHCNGGLSLLLAELGYDVRWHRGGVWSGADEVPLRPYANHLALTVHGLPTRANPGGVWFVDAGLGDALHEPVALRAGAIRQGPFGYSMEPSPVLGGGWRFRHDPSGAFVAMDFEARRAAPVDFTESHRALSTSPESTFVRFFTVARRDATGVDKLVSCSLTRRSGTETSTRPLASRSEWFAALADVFGLTLDDTTPDERDDLYRRARLAQDEWDRSRMGSEQP
jgi:N-hydroxyarylamine O-acetyltransferase